MSETCSFCQGDMHQELVTYTQAYEGKFIVIENVPAWVCGQCGEIYYEPEIVKQIQAVIWEGGEPVRMMETPVYDLNRG